MIWIYGLIVFAAFIFGRWTGRTDERYQWAIMVRKFMYAIPHDALVEMHKQLRD